MVILTAVNHGPGEIKIKGVTLEPTRRQIKAVGGAIYPAFPEFDTRFASPLPATLKPGEEARIMIGYNRNCFLRERHKKLGVVDGFGRPHWLPTKQLRRAEARYKKDFSVK